MQTSLHSSLPGRGRSITILVAKNVVYLIHKQRANSKLTHTHGKNSTRLDRTLPSCHVTTLLVPGLHNIHEHFRCYSFKSRLYCVQATHSYDAELFHQALIDRTCNLLFWRQIGPFFVFLGAISDFNTGSRNGALWRKHCIISTYTCK